MPGDKPATIAIQILTVFQGALCFAERRLSTNAFLRHALSPNLRRASPRFGLPLRFQRGGRCVLLSSHVSDHAAGEEAHILGVSL